MRLVAVAGSSGLIAHSRPSIGRGFTDGIGCNRLATMFTLARTFRLLICASSRAFFTFVNADLSHGNFLTRYPESLGCPFSSSEKSDSSELVYWELPTACSTKAFFSSDQGMVFRVCSLLWIFFQSRPHLLQFLCFLGSFIHSYMKSLKIIISLEQA